MSSLTVTNVAKNIDAAVIDIFLKQAFDDVGYKQYDVELLKQLDCDTVLESSYEDILLKLNTDVNLLARIKTAIVRRRISLTFSSRPRKTCCVITAPHTMKLQRDDCPCHSTEIFTKKIAHRFADTSGGCLITWSKDEIERVSKIVKSGRPPPHSNRDPNYLKNSEIKSSEWFFYLACAKRSLLMSSENSMQLSLHCDIHGMKDSTIDGYDIIFGTLAMEKEYIKHGKSIEELEMFRVRLMVNVAPVLAAISSKYVSKAKTDSSSGDGGGIGSDSSSSERGSSNSGGGCGGGGGGGNSIEEDGKKESIPTKGKKNTNKNNVAKNVVQPFAASVDHDRLTGWAGNTRNTLSQISSNVDLWRSSLMDGDDIVMNSEFKYSVQIELSLRIRQHLHDNKWRHCTMLMNAIAEAAGLK